MQQQQRCALTMYLVVVLDAVQFDTTALVDLGGNGLIRLRDLFFLGADTGWCGKYYRQDDQDG